LRTAARRRPADPAIPPPAIAAGLSFVRKEKKPKSAAASISLSSPRHRRTQRHLCTEARKFLFFLFFLGLG
jgi:hypothetical protein